MYKQSYLRQVEKDRLDDIKRIKDKIKKEKENIFCDLNNIEDIVTLFIDKQARELMTKEVNNYKFKYIEHYALVNDPFYEFILERMKMMKFFHRGDIHGEIKKDLTLLNNVDNIFKIMHLMIMEKVLIKVNYIIDNKLDYLQEMEKSINKNKKFWLKDIKFLQLLEYRKGSGNILEFYYFDYYFEIYKIIFKKNDL